MTDKKKPTPEPLLTHNFEADGYDKPLVSKETVERIYAERVRQHAKWSEQNHNLPFWMIILGEEIGEVCEAICEGDIEHAYKEMTEVAAVACSILDSLRRNELKD